MQAITHLAAGAILGRLADRSGAPRTLALGLGAPLAVASHVILDDLARLTYHPSDPRWDDAFWLVFMAVTVLAALAGAWWWRREAVWMGLALIPDLDWVVRALGQCGLPLAWRPGDLHDALRGLPGPREWGGLMDRLPDWRGLDAASAVEAALVSVLVTLAWALGVRTSTGPGGTGPSPRAPRA
ncbi:MAG: hypothetical protein HY722_13185 [Planctomycetes bacterium]|nr:hypothetical protein [Planctomycetota bacterium]